VAIEPLTNDRWGFETNCFVCEGRNDRGLRVPFAHDTDRDEVVADLSFDDAHSGAPSWVHGGAVLAVLDEAMAWASIALRHRWAVTKESQAWFDRPVLVGRPYAVAARIVGGDPDGMLEVSSEVVSAESAKVCVRARATLSVVTAVQAPGLGIDLGADHGFVAGGGDAGGQPTG
jgi:acyl-coenzyme A thioesterase PaaI-like protein